MYETTYFSQDVNSGKIEEERICGNFTTNQLSELFPGKIIIISIVYNMSNNTIDNIYK